MKIKVFWIGFSSIFVIIGVVIAFFGFRSMKKARASTGWDTVEGVILDSKLDRSDSSDSGASYSADILYEYHLDGAKLNGSRVSFGELSSGDASDASRVLSRYPEGTKVQVYYNPDDPFDAVLEPGMNKGVWFLPAFGAIFATFGGLFVLIGFFTRW